MYEQYAMTAQPLSQLSPARRLLPSDEVFYPTVAVQSLMRILKDSSLSNLHGMVMKVRRSPIICLCLTYIHSLLHLTCLIFTSSYLKGRYVYIQRIRLEECSIFEEYSPPYFGHGKKLRPTWIARSTTTTGGKSKCHCL